MGPSPAKPGADKSSGSPDQVYYGVYIPPDIQPSPEGKWFAVIFIICQIGPKQCLKNLDLRLF